MSRDNKQYGQIPETVDFTPLSNTLDDDMDEIFEYPTGHQVAEAPQSPSIDNPLDELPYADIEPLDEIDEKAKEDDKDRKIGKIVTKKPMIELVKDGKENKTYTTKEQAMKKANAMAKDDGMVFHREWRNMLEKRFYDYGVLTDQHLEMFFMGVKQERLVSSTQTLAKEIEKLQTSVSQLVGATRDSIHSTEKLSKEFNTIKNEARHERAEITKTIGDTIVRSVQDILHPTKGDIGSPEELQEDDDQQQVMPIEAPEIRKGSLPREKNEKQQKGRRHSIKERGETSSKKVDPEDVDLDQEEDFWNLSQIVLIKFGVPDEQIRMEQMPAICNSIFTHEEVAKLASDKTSQKVIKEWASYFEKEANKIFERLLSN
ncbi:TPA_asm: P [Trifolium betacytorhabdovirus 1]|nr:TPA_asm: P [Trifolium betacytorhabdovirus 1]